MAASALVLQLLMVGQRVLITNIRLFAVQSFLLAGIAMLFLPGQGVLTILLGISLMDFPGKRRLEARIVGQRLVFETVNSLRARFGKPAFVLAPAGTSKEESA